MTNSGSINEKKDKIGRVISILSAIIISIVGYFLNILANMNILIINIILLISLLICTILIVYFSSNSIFTVGVITAVTILFIILMWSYLIEFFNYNFKGWQLLILVLSIIGLTLSKSIYNYFKSKKIHRLTKFGLVWDIRIGNNEVISILGPYCPRCSLELPETNPLRCQICEIDYIVENFTNIEGLQRTVKRIVNAELQSGKILLLDWFMTTSMYPSSSITLKNNGITVARNIIIQIKLIIEDEEHNIGTYNYNDIVPDNYISIDSPDPMRSIHRILQPLNLIEFNTWDLTHYEEDDYGNFEEVPTFIDWVTLNRDFTCELIVKVIYTLNNRRINQINRFLLTFTLTRPIPPWGFREGDDNCTINIRKIE